MIKTETIQIQFDFSDQVLNEELPLKPPSSRETDKFVFEFMDMLTAPIITFSSAWADSIPEWLKRDAKTSRLIAGMAKEEMATITEVVAYMITRTFEAPMSYEWANIYLWCSAHYLKKYCNKTDEDLKEIDPPEKLTEYEETLLKRLRVWIYEKRREYLKQRLKQNEKE